MSISPDTGQTSIAASFQEAILNASDVKLSVVAATKGYDPTFIRDMLREHDVRPLIKHHEFGSIQKAQNARILQPISHY